MPEPGDGDDLRVLRNQCTSLINPIVLSRDGYRCIECGRTDTLRVHHIRSLCSAEDNDPGNMVTLCRNCHFVAHRKKNRAIKQQEHLQYLMQMGPMAPHFVKKGKGLLLVVPSPVAGDDRFPFEDGEEVTVRIEEGKHRVVVEKVE